MIQQMNNRILNTLACALAGKKVSFTSTSDESEWEELFIQSIRHNVLPLAADAMPKAFMWSGQNDFLERCAVRTQKEILWQAQKTAELILLYRHLRSRGLHPLMMKGVICRSLYPEPEHRGSMDEDMLVKPAEFQRLHQAMLDYGLHMAREEQNPSEQFEVSYMDKDRGIYVEVHKTPFSPDSPYLDRLNDCFLGVHDRAISQQICGIDFLTLGLEDHLLYLILHALKHFLHCGFGIRQICDIGLFAEKYSDNIDWRSLRTQLENVDAMDFARAVFWIAAKNLLPDNHMAEYLADWELSGIDPEPLLADVLEGGIYGGSTMSRVHSSNMTLRAAAAQSDHGLSAVLYSQFPPLVSMQAKYPYLKRIPVLLPVAWLQRLVRYLWELIRHRGRSNSALTSIRVGNERIRLLEQYNIIKR